MNVGRAQLARRANEKSILLMDENAERRALRTKVLTLHGVEVVAASDLSEAASVWHRDRYDLILLDLRMDQHACMAWRDEIKKESPRQIVAFLVGKPNYIDLAPLAGAYVAEERGHQWGDSMRLAIRKGCALLPQRNGLLEARWRIAVTKKLNGPASPSAQLRGSNEPAAKNIDFDNSPSPAERVAEQES
jgi:CheY-like chemotaxis protein